MRHGLPYTEAGMRIGLLGGSFDPPHRGHLHISRQALRRFGLDRVWWLVSPGNPLKRDGPADLQRRLAACRAMIDHPRIFVSDFEARAGTRLTAETLARLMPRCPGVRFVWLMGADNLNQLHLWEDWHGIMETLPIGVLARPGNVVRAGLSRSATAYARFRLPLHRAAALSHHPAPAWCLVTGPTVDISSTEIRNRGDWVR
ncbi:MAG: nicotinate-nucleotide adenylyltransferase [Rhodobacteraceae bacterium]|nr:nicotinate-nucleotide adenylyltransferase [Paracoccaceae bacterium]